VFDVMAILTVDRKELEKRVGHANKLVGGFDDKGVLDGD